MRFSERMGYRKPKPLMGLEEVDDALKAGLWDVLRASFFSDIYGPSYGPIYSAEYDHTKKSLWHGYFKKPTDSRPKNPDETREMIRKHFLQSDFPETFDFLDFLAKNAGTTAKRERFIVYCNTILEREKSPYRFVGGELAPITSETEIAEIEQTQGGPDVVANHMRKAVSLYADRKNPDYANTIKEAVSAVEAAARLMLGDDNATLGNAVKQLRKAGEIHQAFADGVSKFFGWSSDTVRHATKDGQAEVGEADARFMLVTCSAIANFFLCRAKR